MTNKKLGNDFESLFCEMLSEHGFWVHNMAQTQSGQPADVIATRNGKSYLIDCKVCSSRGFALSRIEENQELSMNLWKQCGNGDGLFAFLIGEQVALTTLWTLLAYRDNTGTKISNSVLFDMCVPFEKWVKKCK